MTNYGLPGHAYHEDHQLGEVKHMCPECGFLPLVFCPFCHGAGVLTEHELSIWQAVKNAEINDFRPPS